MFFMIWFKRRYYIVLVWIWSGFEGGKFWVFRSVFCLVSLVGISFWYFRVFFFDFYELCFEFG